jgi:hypothetical protein
LVIGVLVVFICSSFVSGGHNSAAAVLVADDKIKVVIVQPYQQTAEPPNTEQLYMAVGSVKGEEERGTRDWGTTAPDVPVVDDGGTRHQVSFTAASKEKLTK